MAGPYANPVAELPVDDRETMFGDSPWSDLLQDQFAVVPAAVRWPRRIALRVEEPPKDGLVLGSRSPARPVDHEHSVSRELRLVSSHLPVILHHDLVNDIELEDDHGPRGGRRSPGRDGQLLNACPVAKHRKEQFAQTHALYFELLASHSQLGYSELLA